MTHALTSYSPWLLPPCRWAAAVLPAAPLPDAGDDDMFASGEPGCWQDRRCLPALTLAQAVPPIAWC
jgi:hypothetical protein